MVSLIILSYNTQDLLRECLSSIFRWADSEVKVIVIDNHSQDQSVHMVRTKFPKVRLIESKENLGFAKGVNLGVNQAKSDLVLLLNSDTVLKKEAFERIVEFMHSRDDAGVVGGKLKNKDGSTSSSYSRFYGLWEIFLLLFWRKEKSNLRKPSRVDWVSGGFMLVKKDVFDALGGFDPHFFMYIEDMEFCYRAKKEGYSVYYDPEAVVEHVGQGSSNRSFAISQIYKGLLYFYKKHKPSQVLFLKLMLYTKAFLSLSIGYLTNNSYLKTTYRTVIREAL